jgi:hypothetical protein
MRTCQKCGYERTAHDDEFLSADECPQCGIVYAKFNVAIHAGSNATAYARPGAAKGASGRSGSAGIGKIVVLLILVLGCVYLWSNRSIFAPSEPAVQASEAGFVPIPPITGAEANKVLILGPT